jgi:molybdopterin-guanine dinucleotide biosynthesis protein A
MQTAGFVLAGGVSSRMGRNKAFLMFEGRSLIERAAGAVQEAAGAVTIVGSPEVYGHLGMLVIPDLRSSAGPLAGIESALRHTDAEWNLIVACDMPGVHGAALRRIVEEALGHPEAGCVLPATGEFVEPLCAMYSKRMLPVVSKALDEGIRKVTRAFLNGEIHYLRMNDDPVFHNVNTPEEWRRVAQGPDGY